MSDEPIRPGYKRTEVGVIPQDWDVVRLGEIASFYSGGTPSTSVPEYYGGNIDWITSSDLNKGRIYWVTGKITEKGLRNSSAKLIRQGTLLMALYGATAGIVSISQIQAAINQAVLAILPSSASEEYLFQQLSRLKDWIVRTYTQGGQPNLSGQVVKSIPLALPTVPEQHCIAEVLSDVDALLDALDRLITKKRMIKQGAMQALLTGRVRLPGFTGEWKTKRIGSMLDYERPDNYIVQTTEYVDAGTPVLTANKSFVLGYTDEDFGIYTDLPVIVFDDFTTDSKYADFPFKVKSSAIKLLKPKDDRTNLKYIFERMKLINFSLGDHKRYYISEYQNIEISVPDRKEQDAIAEVLSDMDAEIDVLEKRRAKLRDIKQGMMQELLTGRVRLVGPNAEQ